MLYSIGILVWSLIGLGGSTVLVVVRVAFKLSLGCKDISIKFISLWQYGVNSRVNNVGILV